MLGLFIKDLKLLKAQKKLFMLVGIVTAVVLFNIQDGTEMIGFMAALSVVMKQTMERYSYLHCRSAERNMFWKNMVWQWQEVQQQYVS